MIPLKDDTYLELGFNPTYIQNSQINSYTSSVLSTLHTPPQLTYIIIPEVKWMYKMRRRNMINL